MSVELLLPTLLAEAGPAEERNNILFPSFDITVLIISATFLLRLRHFLTDRFFMPYARSKGLSGIKLHRFAENAWFSGYYILQVFAGLYVLWNAPWLRDFEKTYSEYPTEDMHDFERPELCGLRVYYLVACGFYAQALYGLLFIDERMKDFSEMVTHHILTICLILFSITTSYHRAGSLVILLHDFVDVFLYTAKMSHEIGKELWANILFVMFTISFGILRLICLPYIVINAFLMLYDAETVSRYGSSHFVFKYVTDANALAEVSSYGICINRYCVSTLYTVLFSLTALVGLHIYWYTLVLKLLFQTIMGTAIHDPRIEGNNYSKAEELKKPLEEQTATPIKQKKEPITLEAAHPPLPSSASA